MPDFFDLSAQRAGATPVPPRPPPPPQRMNQPAPRLQPNVVNAQPQVVHGAMQPPPPPQQFVPPHLQVGPAIETSDIRRDLLTEEDAREELSYYRVYRYSRSDDDFDRNDWRKGDPWEKVTKEEVPMKEQNALKRKMLDLKRNGRKKKTVQEIKAGLTPNQQRHLEKTEAELNGVERDPRFQHVLWHIEVKTRRRDPQRDKDITKSSDKHGSRSKSRKRSGSSENTINSVWTRRSSWSVEKKRIHKVRESITAYYKRLPRDGEPTLLMLRQKESVELRMRMQGLHVFPQHIMNQGQMRPPMPQQQQQQQQQQQHQHQQQQQQHQHQHQQQQQQQKQQQQGKQPILIVGDNGRRGEKAYNKKPEKKYSHHSPHRQASSRSSNSSLSYDSSGSDSDTSYTAYSSERGRRSDRRYLEDPAHYGQHPGQRRHSRYDDHRILDGLPRALLPPTRMIAPASLPQNVDFEIAYEAGRADQREELAAAGDYSLRRYARPPPRIIQSNRPAFRIVRPGNPLDLEDEHFRRREVALEEEELQFDLERHMSEMAIRREEEEMLRRESIIDAEERLMEQERLLEQERRFRTPRIYRRASSPIRVIEKPFADMRRRPMQF